MGLIEDYTKLVAGIQNTTDELSGLRPQLEIQREELARYNMLVADLANEQTSREHELFEQQLVTLEDAENERIRNKQSVVQRQIDDIRTQFNKRQAEIKKDLFSEALASRYSLLSQLKDAMQECHLPSSIPRDFQEAVKLQLLSSKTKYSDKYLKQLCSDVKSSYGNVETGTLDVQETFPEKIASFLLLQGLVKSKLSKKTKVFGYFAYLAIIVLICLYFPVIPIALLGVSVVIMFSSYIKRNKNLLDLILPYSVLQDGVGYLERGIAEKRLKLQEKAIKSEQQKMNEMLAPKLSEKAALDEEAALVSKRVRESISDKELSERIQEEYKARVSEVNELIAKINKEIHKLEKFIESDEKSIPKLREKQKGLLEEIKRVYLNPQEPGVSQYLTESFFLGVNEDEGTLVEFRFGGKTTLIVYKGNDCRTNKDLITMMLMQLLSSMAVTVLDIYLTDLCSAGMDYAPFFQEALSDKMHCCGTDKQVEDAIETLHETMLVRRKEVLTEAPSLVEYNNVMLSRKSLPYEYIFLFLQDPTEEQMQNQQLQQLLYNGPVVGIIPIVFVRHKDVNGLAGKARDQSAAYTSFFKAFEGSSFIFDGLTNDLSVSTDLISTIVRMFSAPQGMGAKDRNRRTK